MTIGYEKDGYSVTLAQSEADLAAAQRLRYDVFVAELGAGGADVDHAAGREQDAFDAFADHLLLRDLDTGEAVGVYRLLRPEQAAKAGAYYTETEYDLTPLKRSGRRLLELGRSCMRADHRGGAGMFHLWTGLARYVELHGSEILFGVASLKGTDAAELAGPLSLLHHMYLAPEGLRPRARDYQPMDLLPADALDRRSAMVQMPSLIKSYLRLGGLVGEGAYVDRSFNCIDVCMIMDTDALNQRFARHYRTAAE
ncbi:GNAT family N-acetyltransferase [Aliishimia ponticola]|uniref:L-ornithine N(alpha)-acyltransferase n=1 Tax=Aliishimia ponticola TaxID=2499833 RepID=A0A4S4NFW8_9RHOB|nr:GNAT family N-acyltransferase [Aliishimia ponticola]THH38512.1 GNAT family N-acetyltransferase [Aliishimia ponticola]